MTLHVLPFALGLMVGCLFVIIMIYDSALRASDKKRAEALELQRERAFEAARDAVGYKREALIALGDNDVLGAITLLEKL